MIVKLLTEYHLEFLSLKRVCRGPSESTLVKKSNCRKSDAAAQMFDYVLSHDVASGSDVTLCNKIDKPLVVYRFTGNDMTSITTLRT